MDISIPIDPSALCPQDRCLPLSSWPVDQIYDALPAGGEGQDNFYHVLKYLGEEVPDSLHERHFGRTGKVKIFNAIYKEADGLVVHRGYGFRADTIDSPDREPIGIIVLGFPDLPPTEEQKKTVAKMMGLSEKDFLKVYLDMQF